jgi:replicative DNA helicase
MTGYSIEGQKYLIEAADGFNEVANIWADASINANRAALEMYALSKYGKRVEQAYFTVHEEAMQKLYEAQDSMIEIRETMYRLVGRYSAAETEATRAARQGAPLGHRPEIEDPRYG